jgi:hypothetical protein
MKPEAVRQALEKSPNSYEAHLESGVALDLKGDYAAHAAPEGVDVAPPVRKTAHCDIGVFLCFQQFSRGGKMREAGI